MLNEWTDLVNQQEQNIKSIKMSRNYYCADCKCSTRNPRVYLEHRRDFHRDSITIHKCTLCMYASKHSQKLTRHIRTVHRDIIHSTAHPIGQKALHQPNATASEFLPHHLQGDKSARITTCKLCGLYTANKSVLMQHIAAEHPDVRIYRCDKCEYSHYIRDRYNRHHRYHSMNYVQCKLCEFRTIYRWNLERHMRHHVDSISMGFRCKQCNFTASTKQSITAHEIAHHGGGLNVQQQQQNQYQNQSPPIVNTTNATHATIIDEQIKQNHDDGDELHQESDDLDASDFLEIVFDKSKTPTCSTVSQSVAVKSENALELFQQQHNANNTKFYYCINCRFRNAVDWNQCESGELQTICPNIKQFNHQMANSRYRCGYCQQMSNWKHVIERHCRLVHNTSALIEKFSVEDQSFHGYTPTKRRSDVSETVTTTTKMTKNALDDDQPVAKIEQYDIMDPIIQKKLTDRIVDQP